MSRADAILARLQELHPKAIDLSLERLHRLLARLRHPEHSLPPVIHVAGTNGKGSTIAFMRAILEAAGVRVHVYTSPHLVRFNERIRLCGAYVSDEELEETLTEVETVNQGQPITLFEITTAAACVLFSRRDADVLLLEVGLGGRFDATNVIDVPLASVITPISMDHTEYLGKTLDLIALEKAGIIKGQTPVIIGPQHPEIIDLLERQAARLHAPAHIFNSHWTIDGENGRLAYQDEQGLLDVPAPKLVGRHQIFNAGLAMATLRAAGFDLPATAFEQGMATVDWPARMQRLTHGLLAETLPPDMDLWCDGSHNPDGARALAETLADLDVRVPRPVIAIVGMLSSKDAAGFFAQLAGLVRLVITLEIPGQPASVPAARLEEQAREAGIPAMTAISLEDALTHCRNEQAGSRIVVTGSLYLAGQLLKENGTPPQ